IPWIKVVIGIILGIIMIYAYYLIVLQTRNLKEVVFGINWFMYLFAFLFGFIGVLFFSFAWKTITRAQNIKLSPKDAVSLTFIAYFFEGMVPAGTVPGDAVRAYILTKRTQAPGETVVSTIFAHRLAGMIPYSINGLLCIVLLLQRDFSAWISLLIACLGLISIVAFLGLLVASLKEELMIKLVQAILKIIKHLFKFWNRRLEQFEETSLSQIQLFSESMRLWLKKKRELFGSFILAVAWWLCNGISFYIVVRAFHIQIEFLILLPLYTAASTIRSFPLPLVGGFGLIELTLATLLQPVGVPEEVAFAVPLLARNVFWFLVACSSFFLVREYGRWITKKTPITDEKSPNDTS
ncbi:MAG: YbhN family protein, partial [Candidatus Heimdallarchaeota archaeon]